MKFFGFVDEEVSEKRIKNSLKSMGDSFKINGSECNLVSCGYFGIGHLTFSRINDNQPLWNKDKNLCVVFTGKIFDYEEEKKQL